LAERIECGRAIVGRTKRDGFGYFSLLGKGDGSSASVEQAIAAARKLRDVPGFVVDLRATASGWRYRKMAHLFCAEDTVYAKSKFRNGPKHEDFTREHERVLQASPEPFTKPVVCLIGPGAISSGEGFVLMMKCLPQVTTVGRPTRGASGNPKTYELAGTGLAVSYSRWVNLLPNGECPEGIGIRPDVDVNLPRAAYAKRDPTLEKGLEILRRKVAMEKGRSKQGRSSF
jgi:C-terminal processing protease CtpA/Prc